MAVEARACWGVAWVGVATLAAAGCYHAHGLDSDAAGQGAATGQAGADADDGCVSDRIGLEVESVQRNGNVLVVFDRSGSMEEYWGASVKSEVAAQALVAALEPSVNQLTVGAVFFPSSSDLACAPDDIRCWLEADVNGSCTVNPISADDQIPFTRGADFLRALTEGTPRYRPLAGGRTPLAEGLQRGREALDEASLRGGISVVVLTDGQPNCEWDEAATHALVRDWAAEGIATHVIGLPGATEAEGLLDTVAELGGTGAHVSPTDASTLAREVSSIVETTLTASLTACTFALATAQDDPAAVHFVVNEGGARYLVDRDLGERGGWSLGDDGRTVTLRGQLCDDALAGRYRDVSFESGCVSLRPLQ